MGTGHCNQALRHLAQVELMSTEHILSGIPSENVSYNVCWQRGRPEHTLGHKMQLKKDLFKKDASELVLQDSMVNFTSHMYVG